MATGTRSNVTPVVLREDTRPPVYGDKYSEGASRTFYTTYTEYKKRVAHANAGGAIQREVVSIAELIPSHVQRAFTRVYHESRTITPMRLVDAVRAMLGMVRAQRWSYLQRPRPWREFHHCFGAGGGAGGAVSGSAGRASICLLYTSPSPRD